MGMRAIRWERGTANGYDGADLTGGSTTVSTNKNESKNSKSAWLLPECVNACHSVANVVSCGWQVLDDLALPEKLTPKDSPAF